MANDLRVQYLAHSANEQGEVEPLRLHLERVADLAAGFAASFDAAEWGLLAGLWHDLGKYSTEFQRYIRRPDSAEADLESLPGRVDHSTYGAQYAADHLGPMGDLLAFCIAGHHAGLTNAKGDESPSLRSRLRKSLPSPLDAVLSHVPEEIRQPDDVDADVLLQQLKSRQFDPDSAAIGFQLATFCRLLFSCLVDADFLATERHYSSAKAAARRDPRRSSMAELNKLSMCLAEHMKGFDGRPSPVNCMRARVLADCRDAATLSPGFFSLTVPTGGGKTLSSLSFALDHAVKHRLHRVIYAIPYTSIIEQNADVFREALSTIDEDVLLEHHSNLDPDKESRWAQLASENWDAPIIVTTTVQLFESLFANRTSRCRKLHRIAGSVIVLDEAQSLPVRTLEACLATLRELVRNYGCTVVLCTATQPALARRPEFSIGLDDIHEIVNDVPGLFAGMKRTRIEVNDREPRDNDWIIEQLVEHPQALCIVNTRPHAAELFARLRDRVDRGVYHLSSMMCAEHRSEVLQRVYATLKSDEPCRLVSTQVVEAGVDIDFPFVLRAMAGIDSIAQAAGRCNREGNEDIGRVVVFETDVKPPPEIAMAADDARSVLPEHYADVLSPEAVREYFRLHYWKRSSEWDHHEVMSCCTVACDGRPLTRFRDISERFRMIEDKQRAIFVPYESRGRELVESLNCSDQRPTRDLLRRLQRFTVNVHEGMFRALLDNMVLNEPHEGLFVLMNYEQAYDKDVGLTTNAVSMGFMGI